MLIPPSLRLALLITTITLTGLPSVSTAQPRHTGTIAYRGGDQTEECLHVYRTRTVLRAYRNPQDDGAPIRIVQRNRRIERNDRSMALTVVAEGTYARARQALVFRASSFGATTYLPFDVEPTPRSVRVEAGETIEILDVWCPEGDCTMLFRTRGLVYTASLGDMSGEDLPRLFEMTGMPRTELWLRLTPRAGSPAAWVRVEPGAENVDCDWGG